MLVEKARDNPQDYPCGDEAERTEQGIEGNGQPGRWRLLGLDKELFSAEEVAVRQPSSHRTRGKVDVVVTVIAPHDSSASVTSSPLL
jgi:hypothetical protein